MQGLNQKRRKSIVLRTWVLEADCLDSNSDAASYWCVMLSKLLKCFYTTVFSSAKWD